MNWQNSIEEILKDVPWEKLVTEILKRADIIDNKYTGKFTLNYNQGGITSRKYIFELR